MGCGGIAPPLLTSALGGGEWSPSLPVKELPVLIGYEADWAPELSRTLYREKSLAPAGNRTPVVQLLARRYTD
jgi:hypothetical protein